MTLPDFSGYFALCYHYIRPPQNDDHYPRLLGTRQPDFIEQITQLKRQFAVISPREADRFSYQKPLSTKHQTKRGMLFTFDDGLSDHFVAAQILKEHNISAFFFIPTCILQDNEPANPIILHYALAVFKLAKTLEFYHNALEHQHLSRKTLEIKFKQGTDDPWEIIRKLKFNLKNIIPHSASRKVLLFIYNHLLKSYKKDILHDMHLTFSEIQEILEMGHSIGTHSHSHLSVGIARLSEEEFEKEVLIPQRYLSKTFDTDVTALSYPFGEVEDCLEAEALMCRTNTYRLAYTIKPLYNTASQSPLELGRYMPYSTETTEHILNKLRNLV